MEPVVEAKASPTKRARPKKDEPFVLPDWVPAPQWAAFDAMRNTIRKPMTDYAKALVVTELQTLADAGFPPGAVLDQSTRNNWQDVYKIKDRNNGQQRQSNNRGGSTRDAAQLALSRMGVG